MPSVRWSTALTDSWSRCVPATSVSVEPTWPLPSPQRNALFLFLASQGLQKPLKAMVHPWPGLLQPFLDTAYRRASRAGFSLWEAGLVQRWMRAAEGRDGFQDGGAAPLVPGHLCLVPDASLAGGAVVPSPTASSWSLLIPGTVRTWLLCRPHGPACGLCPVGSRFVPWPHCL